jgi:hypothetical protein
MDYIDFVTKMAPIKPLLNGDGKSIAERLGVPYSTYQNYIKNIASDPDLRQRMYDTCVQWLEEKRQKIENVLN